MDISMFESVRTVVLLIAFVAILIWAWSSKRNKAFDEAAQLPLTEDKQPNAEDYKK